MPPQAPHKESSDTRARQENATGPEPRANRPSLEHGHRSGNPNQLLESLRSAIRDLENKNVVLERENMELRSKLRRERALVEEYDAKLVDMVRQQSAADINSEEPRHSTEKWKLLRENLDSLYDELFQRDKALDPECDPPDEPAPGLTEESPQDLPDEPPRTPELGVPSP